MMPDTVQILTPNREHMRAHLDKLFGRCVDEYPDGLIEIRALKFRAHDKPKSVSFYTAVTKLENAIEFAVKKNKDGWNVYVGVNPREPNTPPFGKTTADDIEIAFFHFADADTPTAAEAIKNTPVDYTFAVTTGRTPNIRPHVYWELDEPTRNLTHWSQQQAGIADHFNSDRVIDTPRIMRLAGTINYPSDKKRAKGYVEELTTIRVLYDNEARDPVDPTALWTNFPFLARVSPLTTHTEPSTGLRLTIDQNGIDPQKCADAIKRGQNLHLNTRDLIAHLVGAGYPDWFIEDYTTAILTPVSDGGTVSQIGNLIKTAREKFNVADPGVDTVALLPATTVDPGPRLGSSFVGPAPDRQWIVEDWIVEGATNALYGGGGVGKSLLAQMLATAAATGTTWLNMPVKQCVVLAVLCEDEYNELHRRQNAINAAMGIDPHHLKDLHLWSRVGHDNLFVTFDGHTPSLTQFHNTVIAKAKEINATFIILDTVADLFGGNEIDRAQVNWFIKTCIGSIANATGATILQLAHPSQAGMATGSGLSGSTAWENAVRSRMYLDRAKGGLPEERIISRKKSNYAASGDDTAIMLFYEHGVLVPMGDEFNLDEFERCLRTALQEVKFFWDQESPFLKRNGPRHLEGNLFKTAEKLGLDRKQMALAIKHALAAEYIDTDRTEKYRGYNLTHQGNKWLRENAPPLE